MAKVTWIDINEAYKEYYGKPLPENGKVASNYRCRFRNEIIEQTIPVDFTQLHDGTIQVSRESIDEVKMKYSSARRAG